MILVSGRKTGSASAGPPEGSQKLLVFASSCQELTLSLWNRGRGLPTYRARVCLARSYCNGFGSDSSQ